MNDEDFTKIILVLTFIALLIVMERFFI